LEVDMIEVEQTILDGCIYFFIKGTGILHKEDGPALIDRDGKTEWRLHGKLHRLDGPAYEQPDGHKEWWVDDQRHRVDGPALIYPDGTTDWWLEGRYFETKELWFEALTEEQKEKALYSEYFIGG